jgi:DNA-binding SARP family transcriptional activator/class 3 adenylate cyclase/tetratricopeptide (TPR) repeat protein
MATPTDPTDGTAIVTVLFADLVESTAVAERVGDDAADTLRHLAFQAISDEVVAAGGQVVKTLGDGAMATFGSALGALRAAIGIRSALSAHREKSRDLPRVRIGISSGEAAREGNDWFGHPVVEAARLCGGGDQDEILVAEVTRSLVGSRGTQRFGPSRLLRLKGIGAVLAVPLLEPSHPARATGPWVREPELSPLAPPGVLATGSSSETGPLRPARLEVFLLGEGHVRLGSSEVRALASHRLQSLLAYLVLHSDEAVPRHRLASMFWPDSIEAQARTNLRQALRHIRRAIPDPDRYLQVSNVSVQWRSTADVAVDLIEFETAARHGLDNTDTPALERAANAYGGDLLVDCGADWLRPERERLRTLMGDVMRRLIDDASERGDVPSAIAHGEHLLRVDPLDEAVHRRLMQLHLRTGDRVRALRAYHACVSVLDRDLGVVPAAETVRLYELVVGATGEVDSASSIVVEPAVAEPALMGRDLELEQLMGNWRAAAAGRGRVVVVGGEPGIGKSRLLEEFSAWCVSHGVPQVRARAYQAEGNVPYGPVIDVLRSDVLRSSLRRLDDVWRSEIGRLLPELADAPPVVAAVMTDESARHRLFESIARVVVQSDRPLVWSLDDLQWCDPETLDLLEFIVRYATKTSSPLLVVATARTEELANQPRVRSLVARLHALDVLAQLSLTSLQPDQAAALAGQLLGPAATEPLIRRLVVDSEGNPLFLVEMARSRRAQPGASIDDGAVPLPPRLQAVIAARLDELPRPARELAAVAAVVGRAFSIDVLTGLVPDDDVVTALDELWRRGIVRDLGADSYDFSHDKIREVAYLTIGPARRRVLHAAVASALEAANASDLDAVAAQLAAHLERAGRADAAIRYYQRAVAVAAHVYAHRDVIALCRSALALVAGQPPGQDRDDAELSFLDSLGVAVLPGMDFRDRSMYERANRLRAQRGLAPDPSTLRLSANAAITHRDFLHARRLGETLLERGEHDGDAVLITEGNYLIGVTSFWLGNLHNSARHLRSALAAYQPDHNVVHLQRFGQDPRTVCLIRLALTQLLLGYDGESSSLCDDALDTAEATGHQYTQSYARVFAAWYLSEAGDAARAGTIAESLAPVVSTSSLAAVGHPMFTAWADVLLGDRGEGLRRLRHALDVSRAAAAALMEPIILLMLAAGHALAGDPAAGLDAASQARTVALREMPVHIPEASRLTGELLLANGAPFAEAIVPLQEAVDTAARQGNVVHELRARTSLLRALRTHDRPAAAAAESGLADVCRGLTSTSRLAELAAAREALGSER